MLISLKVTNIALIEDIEIQFEKGLNILSGETGAGKSIILDSIALILGDIAKVDFIRSGKPSAKVLAMFDIEDYPYIKNYLKEEMGIECNENLLFIERHIFQDKPSNAFINHQKVLVQALKKLGLLLVNIHSQHENQKLFNVSQHIKILDLYCENQKLLDIYSKEFDKALYLKKLIQEIENKHLSYEEKQHFYELAYQELKSASLKDDEVIILEEEIQELKHQSSIGEILEKHFHHLYDKDFSAISSLQALSQDFSKIENHISEAQKIEPFIQASLVNIEPIIDFLTYHKEQYSDIEEKIVLKEERYSKLKDLERKYKKTINELILYQKEIAQSLNKDDSSSSLEELKQESASVTEYLKNIALQIREKRIQGAQKLQNAIQEQLVFLRLPHTQIKIQLTVAEDENGSVTLNNGQKVRLMKDGLEKVQFLISFNQGEELKPLHKVGSGGEISRVIVAIKSVLQNIDQHSTQIFDEVDSGIGGETAFAVGKKLKEMSRFQQIICITHLPQIAAMGNLHYNVYKIINNERTETVINILTQEARVTEISRMLSGDNITLASTQHAKELLQNTF